MPEGAQGVERGVRRDPTSMPSALTSLATDRDGLILISRDIVFLEETLRLSGPANLYAELRPGRARHAVLAAARRLRLPVVATNGVVAARAEEWSRHRLLRAIALNTTLSSLPAEEVWPPQAWLCSGDELARHFPDCPEAIRAAEEIAEQCSYTIPVGRRTVPPRVADTDSAFAQLREMTLQGARWRYPVVTPELQERLELELGIIARKGFADYFLVVRDIVRNGPTHCGRGSVANSVVSYCLGITHVDPIRSQLVFERFLNLERSDPPDIDLDFPWDERDKVLEYVFRQYPRLHSAMVANHNCFQPRGALREVAKVHGRPAGEIREVTRRIPFFEDGERQLPDLIATHPNFQGLSLANTWQEFARLAVGLVGIPTALVGPCRRSRDHSHPAHRLCAGGAGGQDPRVQSRSRGSGHPIRKRWYRRRWPGEDRSPRQSLAGGDPRCHRGGPRPYQLPDRLYLVYRRRRRSGQGAVPHRQDHGRLLHRIPRIPAPLRQEPGGHIRAAGAEHQHDPSRLEQVHPALSRAVAQRRPL